MAAVAGAVTNIALAAQGPVVVDKLLLMCSNALSLPLIHLLSVILLVTTATIIYLMNSRVVYLIDYACFIPKSSHRISPASFIENIHLSQFLDDDYLRFLTRISERSGLGSETYLPSPHHYIPPYYNLQEAHAETEMVIFTAIDNLIAKTCISPGAIDILVVNGTFFSPTPSMADMVVSRYKLRGNIRNVQLSGMGCSVGLIAIGLARSLLQTALSGAYAMVVSTDIITGTYYAGKKREMQLSNMLFHMGGAAMLLSTSRVKARYQLTQLVRISTSADDKAYRCVFIEEDGVGNKGVSLSKDLVSTASEALKANLTTLAPLVLPVSEQLLFVASVVFRKILGGGATLLYIPDFSTAFEYFCVHVGGRAVVDAVQRSLNLSDEHCEPSRMTLHRFGNTSSSSLFYELAYIEAKGRMRKGDRVLMIGFGSGYKCNSAVWRCIRPTQDVDKAWADSIHRYPVEVPKQV